MIPAQDHGRIAFTGIVPTVKAIVGRWLNTITRPVVGTTARGTSRRVVPRHSPGPEPAAWPENEVFHRHFERRLRPVDRRSGIRN